VKFISVLFFAVRVQTV